MGMLARAGLSIGVIMVGGLFFSTVFKKKIEETIAPVIFAIISILYVFYCFDKLYVGYAFTLLLIAAGGVYSVFDTVKNKRVKDVAQRLLTSGFFIFLALCVALYFITSKSIVQLWDDMRLWGAVPKVMFYDGSLQLGTDAMIFGSMQSYYPGMQLFAFFITKTMGVFYDGGIYFAYGVLGVSMLITVLSNCKKKMSIFAIVAGIIMLLLPLTFYNNMFDSAVYYLALYIDPVLGMMCGYIFYLVANDVNKDTFSQIRFCLSMVVIIQLKDSAILFAVVALVCAATMQMMKMRGVSLDAAQKKARLKSIGIWIAATAIPVIISSVLWKIQIGRFGVNTHIGLGTPRTDKPWSIVWGFIKTLFSQDLVQQTENPKITGIFTYFTVMVAFSIISIIIYKIINKEDKKKFLIPVMGLFVSNILFAIGLCYMYIGLGWEVFNSYQRYINTVLLALLTFIVLYLLEQIFLYSKEMKKLALPAIATLCIFFLPFNLVPQKFSPWIELDLLWEITAAHSNRIATGIVLDQKRDNSIQTDDVQTAYASTDSGEKRAVKVDYVMSKKDTLDILHHTLHFGLLDRNVQITATPLTESLRPFYTAATQAEQKLKNENWLKSADYIYVFDYDQKFIDNFGVYFENGAEDISEASLYKITDDEGKLSLKYVVI